MYSCKDPICDPICDFCWFCESNEYGVPVCCKKDNNDEFDDGFGYCEGFLCRLHEKLVLSDFDLGLARSNLGRFMVVKNTDGEKTSGILNEWIRVNEHVPGGEIIVLELSDGTYKEILMCDISSIEVYPWT